MIAIDRDCPPSAAALIEADSPAATNILIATIAALVGALIGEARSTGKRLRHMVFVLNEGARRFYERLGFRVYGEFSGYLQMEWRPEGDE